MLNIKKYYFLFKDKGLFHIFGSNIINNIIQFFTGIMIVNLISKPDYGIYTYAYNIISFFLLMRGLGIVTGMLQFCSESKTSEEMFEIFKFSFIKSNVINGIISIILLIYALFTSNIILEARLYLIFMVGLPLAQGLFDYSMTYFRIKMQNRQFSYLNNLNSIFYFFFSIIGAKFFGIFGIIIARYFAYILCFIISLFWAKNDLLKIFNAKKIECYKAVSIFKYSLTVCASNSLSELLYLLDVFLIGVFIANSSIIASYKVATQIPNALIFIPSSIMVFIYPYFAKNRNNIPWLKENIKKIFLGLAVINGCISIALFILAPLIIEILWGNKYIDALPVFRLLAINFFFLGTFRIPCGNILAMVHKVNVNLLISIITGISNIVLDVYLIQVWGSIGAAFATMFVVLLSSGLSAMYLFKYLNSNEREGN